MSYNNIDQLSLGNILQIAFTDGIRNQISSDFRDFEMIKRLRTGNTLARELRFMFQTAYGVSAIQYRDPGTSNRSFPRADQASISEKTAKFKEINATIELEYNLWERANKSPEKYGQPLALEIDSKASASKRRLAADLYQDGTGVIGQLAASSAALTSPASNSLVFQLATTDSARGHVGDFEFNDILILRSNSGAASALDTNLATEPVYWKVLDKDRELDKVTLQGLDSNFSPVATISAVSVQPTAGDVFYRFGQPTIPDLSAITTSTDYGLLTEVMAGLASLAAADNRLVHGIQMTGATKGTEQDCGANPIDVKYIQKAMDKVKVAVGQDRYKWKQMLCAPETQASLIESREGDRRFLRIEDNKRGIKGAFGYAHGNDVLEIVTSEYCPKKRIYMIPEMKAGEKVVEFHGSDFTTVKGPGMSDFNLKPASAGGYVNTMVSYLQAVGVMIAKHPAAIAVVRNFTNT